MSNEEQVRQDAPTRARVVATILEHGPSTAVQLATQLHLAPAGIRRHLDQLVEQGLVEAREQRILGPRRRGRPARVFALTDAGRDEFRHDYDELAAQALEFLQAAGGDDAVKAFARHRLADFEERARAALADADDKPGALARLLSRDGFAASVTSTPLGEQVCQHHCPVAHVAGQFPQLCEAETELFAELLGTHVQRLATIAHGDGVCTTHLPLTERVSS